MENIKEFKMRALWYSFIDDYTDQIPYKPLSVILEAFYWYEQMNATDDTAFMLNAKNNVRKLMKG
jgi:hypothetical protein